MPLKNKKFIEQERSRLSRYQHQHRGLDFMKLWLPPITDKNVNIIGYDNHIYRGKIPRVPLDELSPDADFKSIDETELYKEIKEMKFLPIPPQEPPGPGRRIAGEYTKTKKLMFAPVKIYDEEQRVNTTILSADGKVYKGTSESPSIFVLDSRNKATKIKSREQSPYSTNREKVIPTIVSLQVEKSVTAFENVSDTLIEMPVSEINRIIKNMRYKTSSPSNLTIKLGKGKPKGQREKKTRNVMFEEQEAQSVAEAENDESDKKESEGEEAVDEEESEEVSEGSETEESEKSEESDESQKSDESGETGESEESEETSELEELVASEESGEEETDEDEEIEEESVDEEEIALVKEIDEDNVEESAKNL